MSFTTKEVAIICIVLLVAFYIVWLNTRDHVLQPATAAVEMPTPSVAVVSSISAEQKTHGFEYPKSE